jgi:DNA-binding transcriptional MocR family regulator
MHLTLALPLTPAPADVKLARAAFEHGLSPRPLSAYGTGGIEGFNGLVMGYANTHEDHMAAAVKRLALAAAQLG